MTTQKEAKEDKCLIEMYLDFLEDTEPPEQFHRWSFISCIATQLGRNVYFTHGHSKIYPNMYTMLVGAPATRKSTSIKIAKKILEDAGFNRFSFSKSSKQKFLLDWSDGALGTSTGAPPSVADMLDAPVTGLGEELLANECFIAQDEFIDFIGQGNFDFITLLTTLWDNPERYDERFKNSNPVSILTPTLNVLGGITTQSIAMALPQEANGSGFLSRLILVYSNPSGKSITFPKTPREEHRQVFISRLQDIRKLRGEAQIDSEGRALLTKIYTGWRNELDVKLEYYAGRRLTHLLKLCLVCAALRNSLEITCEDIIKANTILHFTECSMSNALQMIGTARNLEAMTKVFDFIARHNSPVRVTDVYKNTVTYFEKLSDLMQVLNNLQEAKRIHLKDGMLHASNTKISDLGDTTNLYKYIREYKGSAVHDSIQLLD